MSSRLQRFRHHAMATHFEVIVADVDPVRAAQAAEEVFREIDVLEAELSRFRPGSDICQIRSLRAGESLVIGLATFDCLALAQDVSAATGGAFDVTIGPLFRLWRDDDGRPLVPSSEAIEAALRRTGSRLYELDEDSLTLTVHADHLECDLGGIGKGYALDQAARLLDDWGIEAALLNAGDSTVLARRPPSDAAAWTIAAGDSPTGPVRLVDAALSGSGFDVKGAHIIDPRTGRPVEPTPGNEFAWARAPGAALADALSTAFTIMRRDEIEALCGAEPEIGWLTLDTAPGRGDR